MQDGTDSGEVATGLAPLDDFEGFPTMYLTFYARNFRRHAGFFSRKSDTDFPIFPLLLVYDKSRMSFDRRTFKYRVPIGPDRNAAILRAFVLDYSASPK